MTTFVNGDSYNPGNFSTRTSIVDLHTGDTIANVEDFRVYRDGEIFKRRNFNFWGITFAHDDDRFYATLGSGKESYLVQGSIKSRIVRPRKNSTGLNAACGGRRRDQRDARAPRPSLAPGQQGVDDASGRPASRCRRSRRSRLRRSCAGCAA